MDIKDTLINQANDIASKGINGWGNTMLDAAEQISQLQKEIESLRSTLGQACVAALQEDYSVIDEIAREVKIEFVGDNILASLQDNKDEH